MFGANILLLYSTYEKGSLNFENLSANFTENLAFFKKLP